MKKIVLAFTAGVLIGSGAMWWWRHAVAAPPLLEATARVSPRPERGIRLTPEQVAAAGIATSLPVAARLANYETGYGRVLDPAPLFTLVAEVRAGDATSAASAKERARVQQLFADDDNVSARALEAAEAAATRDRALAESARARLRAGWGDAFVENTSREPLLKDLSARAAGLVRVDIPAGSAPARAPQELVVERMNGTASPVTARVLGPAPQADAQFQGYGYLTVLENAPPPGTVLRALIPADGRARDALSVGSSAIVRHQGQTFVYVETKESTYERRPVALGRSLSGDVVIVEGLQPTERVVTTGGQQLLSHEQMGSPDRS